ncbi:MAG: HAMP domain-containing sensor histidine kinase [Nocardioides sp.]
MTTDSARRPRQGLSVRARFTTAVAVLVAAALTLAGLIAYAIEAQRIQEFAVEASERELAEFGALQENGVDVATGERFEGAEAMIRAFLTRNVPSDDEVLIGWWLDKPQARSASDSTLHRDQQFISFVGTHVEAGGTFLYDDPDEGKLIVAIQPIRTGSDVGALVVVTNLAEARSGLFDTMRTYAIVALALALLSTLFTAWLTRRLLAPLETLRRTAREVSASDLSRRLPVTGNDDITMLTRDVNEMLDRLDAGFESQRRFLDDAGHELRTPLTVLGGHLELLDPGNRDETENTRALLLDEVGRMSRLVDDLILLAKSRRPDFLRRTEVDVDELTRTVHRLAGALGDRDWRLVTDGVGTAYADPQRLTQAMLQLADNAVKHSDEGTVIEIGSSLDEETVRMWVRDRGDGIAASDHTRVLERFARSHVRSGDDGFGLGLSIVGVIAQAHGGVVVLSDVEPHGLQVLIEFPREETPWHIS